MTVTKLGVRLDLRADQIEAGDFTRHTGYRRVVSVGKRARGHVALMRYGRETVDEGDLLPRDKIIAVYRPALD